MLQNPIRVSNHDYDLIFFLFLFLFSAILKRVNLNLRWMDGCQVFPFDFL